MSTSNEIELCFYCEVKDPSGFEKANATEAHEQYEYRLPPAKDGSRRGRVRVRRTDKNNETTFEEVIKLPIDPSSTLGDKETPIAITEAYFNAWKQLHRVDGTKKIRYTFITSDVEMVYQDNTIKLPPLKFEVDRLISAKGDMSKWVKLDIEVQDIIKMLKDSYEEVDAAKFEIKFSCLPLGIGKVISAATKDADERAAIENFYAAYAIPYAAATA